MTGHQEKSVWAKRYERWSDYFMLGLMVLAVCLLIGVLFTAKARAAEIPSPCGDDARERCVPYRAGQITVIYLAPGATTTIELPPTETVFSTQDSDDQIISGKSAQPVKAPDGSDNQSPNFMVSVPGGAGSPAQFVVLKALRELHPQPFTVIARVQSLAQDARTEYRRHSFELRTRKGALTEDVPDTFFAVRIVDQDAEAQVRRERMRAQQEIDRARAREAMAWGDEVRARRRAVQAQSAEKIEVALNRAAGEELEKAAAVPVKLNEKYGGMATKEDRASLAPDGIWDDGSQTFLRYAGNRRVPMVWQVLPDGKEGVVGQHTQADPETHGTLLVIDEVLPMIRIRDGAAVLCIVNRGYDPVGRNTGTGTVAPGVQRKLKEASSG